MVKVEVIENFHLGKYNELKNIQKKVQTGEGMLSVGDEFECTNEMAEYLTGKNSLGRAFVKIIEIIPEEVKQEPVKKVEEKVEKTTAKKKTTKRTTNSKKNV